MSESVAGAQCFRLVSENQSETQTCDVPSITDWRLGNRVWVWVSVWVGGSRLYADVAARYLAKLIPDTREATKEPVAVVAPWPQRWLLPLVQLCWSEVPDSLCGQPIK